MLGKRIIITDGKHKDRIGIVESFGGAHGDYAYAGVRFGGPHGLLERIDARLCRPMDEADPHVRQD